MEDDSRRSVSPIALTRRDMLAGSAAMLAQLPALGATTADAAPNGAMTLAWHTTMAPRWLDPQQHDGTATPDNFLFALHDALIKNFRARALRSSRRSPKNSSSPRTPRARPSGSATGIKFHDGDAGHARRRQMELRKLSRRARPRRFTKDRGRSTSSTSARSVSASRSRFSISRSCWAPATSAAPAGSCRQNTTNRSARTGSCRSRSAPGPTSWSRRSRA